MEDSGDVFVIPIYGWSISILGNPELTQYVAFSQAIVSDSQLPVSSSEIQRIINLSIKEGLSSYYSTLDNTSGDATMTAPNVNNLPSGGVDAIVTYIQNYAINVYGFRTSSYFEFANGVTIPFATPVILPW